MQVDLASFLLQSSPSSGQPIYEEIPGQPLLRGSSDHSSDYVDTTSGYHTLPLDNEYCEVRPTPIRAGNQPSGSFTVSGEGPYYGLFLLVDCAY